MIIVSSRPDPRAKLPDDYLISGVLPDEGNGLGPRNFEDVHFNPVEWATIDVRLSFGLVKETLKAWSVYRRRGLSVVVSAARGGQQWRPDSSFWSWRWWTWPRRRAQNVSALTARKTAQCKYDCPPERLPASPA
eukprot:scaffold24360_cov135-Isochrysis_galbana.AAC.1